jgi:hypothetical protein
MSVHAFDRVGGIVAVTWVLAAFNPSCGGGTQPDGGAGGRAGGDASGSGGGDAAGSGGAGAAGSGGSDAGPCGGYQQACCATQPRCNGAYSCTGVGTNLGVCLPV